MSKVGHFTGKVVNSLRERLFRLQSETKAALMQEDKDRLLDDAQHIGDEFLQLEKYVNLNYLSFHKILKKVSDE
jgi:SPX domain protein involved in polyphosphate accumulation